MDSSSYSAKVGTLIQETRQARGMTQAQLAQALGTSQSAINRIEKGGQNISLDMLNRISEVLSSQIVTLNPSGTVNFRVEGGNKLSGRITAKTSKNAAVALLCASLLNRGKTTLRHVARIEEVNRILEVLNSVGVKTRWFGDNDLEIIPPAKLKLDNMDIEAARKTRSIIMFLGPLMHRHKEFNLPYAGGCSLGERTVEPHLSGLEPFGLTVDTVTGHYAATAKPVRPERAIVLSERGDTVTENVLMAAALNDGVTIIRNASPNYMVQDLCFYLEKLGVKIDGIGTTTLTVHGVRDINKDVEYAPAEDPIEVMSFIAAAIVTKSEITIERAPIEFLEIDLKFLENMGFEYELSDEYTALNGRTRLVDITTKQSTLHAPIDKIHAMPFPGLNIDNLPFFAVIAASAKGRTMIHDWVYENRAIYLTELSRLNANVQLIDPHRLYIHGPTKWKPAEVVTPPALRPAVVILLGMLAAPGVSTLRNVYSINRGYEELAERLNTLGAKITVIRDIAE
ncbi:UDP-N-acetylglucosamine 1-carboxyvinyltransferase [Candidatus Saccharibacteria bacterium]|nr:UDP-N-acetylglucosamine 1-carboxyvinyltransferase [Candidatus Saccharibacteria bacterium]MBJ58130.1 UDP-N-acetylglucosamine 1-carboxyvinyltransferase [Candidatus Saccharibacteria bacterium]MBQ68445.1 UDP-N-acetylglucosamine 1-carboxyvinyltransferase [Candidatus Saccharibacteria bacterium]